MKKPKSKEAVKRLRKRLHAGKKSPPMNRARRPMTSLEQRVADLLDELNIEYERELPLRYQAGYRYYDFHLFEHGILIEADGSYYHDTQGKASFVIMMAKKNDAIKNWLAKKEGFQLLRIKEDELKEGYDGVKEKISLLVGEIKDGTSKRTTNRKCYTK